jgi:hypothetical protein
VDYVDGIGGLKVDSKEDWPKVFGCINSTSPTNSPVEYAVKGEYFHRDKTCLDKSSSLLDDVSRCLVLNRKDRYLSSATPPGHFYGNFQALCLAAIEKQKDVPPRFLDWFEHNKSLYIRGHSLEELCMAVGTLEEYCLADYMDMSDCETSFESRLHDTTQGMARRFITTNEGNIGMASCRVAKGDQVCILLGCNIPLVLRQRENEPYHEVIGECYLHGLMNGEIMNELDNRKFKIEEFILS